RDGVWMPVREVANNLPIPVTSFIGRQRELGEVTQRLAQTRLMTLLGTGGLGKTRLAIQTARSMLGEFADGAWFVDLAPLSDPAHVPQAVASALRIKEEPGRTSIDALLQHLGPRELLLVLDNCEHVVQAAAELTHRLLASAADVRVLATSREPLHITGEVGYVLSPMELPDERGCTDAQLRASEAVRLFVERAQAVQPGFAIDTTNAATVVEICRRLDAIPLAIELAAARMRSLSIDQVAQRLNDRFRLLTGGDRTAMARQQTLRALIDWSHDLLGAPERTLLRRLAVFAGGWALDAAESVGADDSLAGDDVVDVLAQLVDRSLVSVASGGQRYRLLESVRAYALERLEESGDSDAARVRHLDHYLALAQRAAPALWGAQQGTWVARLDEDRDNLFAAHRCCDRVPDGATKGLLLVSRLQLYWMPAGLLEVGYRLTVEALARHGAHATSEVRCGASYAACQLAYFMRRLDEALAHGVASLEIARALGLTHRAIDALLMMGYVADECGRAEDSLSHFEEALALARRTNDRARLSYTLNGLGGRHMNSDDEAAIPLFEESLQLAREVDDDESVAITALNLARCLINRGRREEAADHLSEALQTSQRIGATRAVTYAVDVCAMLAACSADAAAAARLLGAAEAQWQRLGVTRPPAEAAQAERATTQAQAQLGVSEFTSCHALGQALSLDEAAGDVQAWLVGRIGCVGARPAVTRAG
ncbi:MAG TPA: tetratricopeptide repeat protein, partial [Burkholderiaceae bacterium]|nr:tetratricopeptide repeat protein [Burkholderiaceae bacterium]